jgi:two-component system, OmpR family, response regulator
MTPSTQGDKSHKIRTTSRLLVVEDDIKLAQTIQRGLQREGFSVDLAHTGPDALEQAAARDYNAVVLDVLLPGLGGHEVCQQLRNRDPWLPVLMLTALDDVEDRIRGLEMGADDYLVKPFDFGELVARVKALIRRGPSERPAPIELGDLRADPLTRMVTWADETVELTPREYTLLEFMLRRPGQIVSRSQLLEQVWAEEYEGSPNVVDVYIGYVRRKLERDGVPPLIRTVRGSGFVLDLAEREPER